MSEATLKKLAMQVRHWGRWGPSDEIGTLNFITPDTIARSSSSKSWRPTAPPTGATSFCWWPRRCRSRAASGRRSNLYAIK
jgi:hypothetical protein